MKAVILLNLQPLVILAAPEEDRLRQSLFWAMLEQKIAILQVKSTVLFGFVAVKL